MCATSTTYCCKRIQVTVCATSINMVMGKNNNNKTSVPHGSCYCSYRLAPAAFWLEEEYSCVWINSPSGVFFFFMVTFACLSFSPLHLRPPLPTRQKKKNTHPTHTRLALFIHYKTRVTLISYIFNSKLFTTRGKVGAFFFF